jgi:hypothetical protein
MADAPATIFDDERALLDPSVANRPSPVADRPTRKGLLRGMRANYLRIRCCANCLPSMLVRMPLTRDPIYGTLGRGAT